MILTERELSTAMNALRVAVERFDEDARVCNEGGYTRLGDQFTRQADETRALIDKIEAAQ